MTRIEFWAPAGEHEQYMSRAFDRVIGQQVPMRGPGGRVMGRCTVVAVVVDEGGGGATWTIETEDPDPAEYFRSNELAVSFAFPEPEDAPRDPLGSGEVRIRWRDGPAVPG